MSEAFFGLLGVVVGSFIPWIKDSIEQRKSRAEHARYLAVRVICILDEYVDKCVAVVADDGTRNGDLAVDGDGSGQQCYLSQVAAPEAPIYPLDIDWKSIDSDLMYRILALPDNARKADRHMAAERALFFYHKESIEVLQEGYTNLGLEAIKLTEALRKKYKIPSENFELNSDWNAEDFLKKTKIEIEERKAKRAASYENINKKLELA